MVKTPLSIKSTVYGTEYSFPSCLGGGRRLIVGVYDGWFALNRETMALLAARLKVEWYGAERVWLSYRI